MKLQINLTVELAVERVAEQLADIAIEDGVEAVENLERIEQQIYSLVVDELHDGLPTNVPPTFTINRLDHRGLASAVRAKLRLWRMEKTA